MKTLSKNINIKNICADCSKYLIFCRVSEPGFVVEFQQEINKVIKNPNNSSDDSLAECVPDAYQITDLLEGSACFWSSELGCHKVLGRRDQERGFNDLSCVECLSSDVKFVDDGDACFGHSLVGPRRNPAALEGRPHPQSRLSAVVVVVVVCLCSFQLVADGDEFLMAVSTVRDAGAGPI
ncbi:hypothetical protein ACLKA6_015064 [Drosophila palustris]